MNKLREKFKKAFPYSPSSHFDELEQITDDFSVAFGKWLVKNYISKTPIELQQKYFKENIYGK